MCGGGYIGCVCVVVDRGWGGGYVCVCGEVGGEGGNGEK